MFIFIVMYFLIKVNHKTDSIKIVEKWHTIIDFNYEQKRHINNVTLPLKDQVLHKKYFSCLSLRALRLFLLPYVLRGQFAYRPRPKQC